MALSRSAVDGFYPRKDWHSYIAQRQKLYHTSGSFGSLLLLLFDSVSPRFSPTFLSLVAGFVLNGDITLARIDGTNINSSPSWSLFFYNYGMRARVVS